MGLQSKLSKQFVPMVTWTQSDWDHEFDALIADVSALMVTAGRTGFPMEAWPTLNVIHETAKAARRANNMPGLRDALARYRVAAKHFLGIGDQQP